MSQQKTVFISYRRKHIDDVQMIYSELMRSNYDVFLDFETLHRGSFPRQLMGNIQARAHFVLVLGKGTLARCLKQGDWVLREIHHAIAHHRNCYIIKLPSFADKTDASLLQLDIENISPEKLQSYNISLEDFASKCGIDYEKLKTWPEFIVEFPKIKGQKKKINVIFENVVENLIEKFAVAKDVEIDEISKRRLNPKLLLAYEDTDSSKAGNITEKLQGYVISTEDIDTEFADDEERQTWLSSFDVILYVATEDSWSSLINKEGRCYPILMAAAELKRDILPLYYIKDFDTSKLDNALHEVFSTAQGAVNSGNVKGVGDAFYNQIKSYLQFSEDNIYLLMKSNAAQDYFRAVDAQRRGDYLDAEIHYHKALMYMNDLSQNHQNLEFTIENVQFDFAELYLRMSSKIDDENYLEAYGYLEKVIQGSHIQVKIDALLKRSGLYADAEKWAEALKDAQDAIAIISPDNKNAVEAPIWRATASYHLKNYDGAYDDLQNLADLEFGNQLEINTLGDAYLVRALSGAELDKERLSVEADFKNAIRLQSKSENTLRKAVDEDGGDIELESKLKKTFRLFGEYRRNRSETAVLTGQTNLDIEERVNNTNKMLEKLHTITQNMIKAEIIFSLDELQLEIEKTEKLRQEIDTCLLGLAAHLQVDKSLVHMNQAEIDKAAPALETAEEILDRISTDIEDEKERNERLRAEIHNHLAFPYSTKKQYREAIDELEKAEKILRAGAASSKSQRMMGHILYNKAITQMHLGEFSEAKLNAQEVQKIAQDLKNLPLELKAVVLLGQITEHNGETEEHYNYVEEAIRLAEEAKIEDATLNLIVNVPAMTNLFNKGQYEKAREEALRLQAKTKQGDPFYQSALSKELGDSHKALERYSEAISHYEAVTDKTNPYMQQDKEHGILICTLWMAFPSTPKEVLKQIAAATSNEATWNDENWYIDDRIEMQLIEAKTYHKLEQITEACKALDKAEAEFNQIVEPGIHQQSFKRRIDELRLEWGCP